MSTPNTLRSLVNLDLRGSVIFSTDLTSFPPSPRSGETVLKDGVLWCFSTVAGVQTWYPLTNKKNSYVHTQAVESFQWTINHGLETSDVVCTAYDFSGQLVIANLTVASANTIHLHFTSATAGRAVVFADSERYASNLDVGNLEATALSVASGTVTADDTGLRVNGDAVVTKDATSGLILIGGDVLPVVSGVSKLGSPTQKFAAIYTKEMYLDANTLYVDGVPVIGSSSNSIQISADPNQGIRVGTTGTGQTVLDSQASTLIQTNGTNANVVLSAGGTGSMVQVSSNTEVRLTAPTVRVSGDFVTSANATVGGNLTLTGNLTVHGTTSTVNSTVVTVKDNVVVYNAGEVGAGVTSRYSGLQIDRGELTDVRLVFDEQDDRWKAGVVGGEVSLATVTDLVHNHDAQYAAVSHGHTFLSLEGKPTTLAGYGVTDAYTRAEADALFLSTGVVIDGGVL